MTNESWASERAKQICTIQENEDFNVANGLFDAPKAAKFLARVQMDIEQALLEARGPEAQGFEEAYHKAFFNNLDFQNSPRKFAEELWQAAFSAGAQSRSLRLPSDNSKEVKDFMEKFGWGDIPDSNRAGAYRMLKWLKECLNATKKPDEKESV